MNRLRYLSGTGISVAVAAGDNITQRRGHGSLAVVGCVIAKKNRVL